MPEVSRIILKTLLKTFQKSARDLYKCPKASTNFLKLAEVSGVICRKVKSVFRSKKVLIGSKKLCNKSSEKNKAKLKRFDWIIILEGEGLKY